MVYEVLPKIHNIQKMLKTSNLTQLGRWINWWVGSWVNIWKRLRMKTWFRIQNWKYFWNLFQTVAKLMALWYNSDIKIERNCCEWSTLPHRADIERVNTYKANMHGFEFSCYLSVLEDLSNTYECSLKAHWPSFDLTLGPLVVGTDGCRWHDEEGWNDIWKGPFVGKGS